MKFVLIRLFYIFAYIVNANFLIKQFIYPFFKSILFERLSNILSGSDAFARAIGNLWSICLGVNILRLEWSETLSEKPVPSIYIGNILLSKALRTLSLTSKSAYKFSRASSFFCFFLWIFWFYLFLKIQVSTKKSLWSLPASFRTFNFFSFFI